MRTTLQRGQTLVLFALTLLLLTLMVLLTLQFGMRTKEKVELQNIADAAAYSNAVATARTLNSISLLNRAEVSVMVEAASVNSLISWSTMYLAAMDGITNEISLKFTVGGYCNPLPAGICQQTVCNRYQTILNNIATEQATRLDVANTTGPYQNADRNAGIQLRSIQGAATGVHSTYEVPLYNQLINNILTAQTLTKAVVNMAQTGNTKWGAEITAPDGADLVAIRETRTTDGLWGCNDPAAYACSPRGDTRELGVKAMMGSRGYAFVTSRAGGDGPLMAQIQNRLLTGMTDVVPAVTDTGSGRAAKKKGAHEPPGAAPTGISGDDEGDVTLTVTPAGGCSDTLTSALTTWVYSSDSSVSDDDTHEWTPTVAKDVGWDIPKGPDQRHTLGACTNCPGVWTMFIDLNPAHVADGPAHLWGQPKNYAYLVRDYGLDRSTPAGADPWNFFFTFKFTSGAKFDNRGLKTLTSGIDIRRQGALAAGVAYYHRMNHWQEPPNFFNPFWRATLVSTAVDSEGDPQTGTDIVDTLGTGSAPYQQQVVSALKANGFKGWQ